jgi:hypothetical protein
VKEISPFDMLKKKAGGPRLLSTFVETHNSVKCLEHLVIVQQR